jgi:hypothetical protein
MALAFNNFFMESICGLTNGFDYNSFLTFFNSHNVVGIGSHEKQFSIVMTDSDKIRPLINTLKNKGPGVNSIQYKFIVLALEQFCDILTTLINTCLSTSQFPPELKVAKVIPIFKKGCKTELGNYRPISILPSFSKVYERIMYQQMIHFLSNHLLLSKHQHGFRSKHSTISAVVCLQNIICRHVNNGNLVAVIFLDLSKAFDIINHSILLHKLKALFNFSNSAIQLIQNYLSQRSQFTCFNSQCSPHLTITCGVPQGSILGPLLFLLYINDFPSVINSQNEIIMYADDTTLIIPAKNKTELEWKVNQQMQLVNSYCKANCLIVNGKKSQSIIFNAHQLYANLNLPTFELDNQKIEIVKDAKFLGFLLDHKLTWKHHFKMVSSKLSTCCFILQRLRGFMPTEILTLVFNAIGLSHVNYFAMVQPSYRKGDTAKLKSKYDDCGAVINNCTKSALHNYDWPALHAKMVKYRYLFLFKLFNLGHFPSILDDFAIKQCSHNLRSKSKYCITTASKQLTEQCISFWGPRLWNTLTSKPDLSFPELLALVSNL